MAWISGVACTEFGGLQDSTPSAGRAAPLGPRSPTPASNPLRWTACWPVTQRPCVTSCRLTYWPDLSDSNPPSPSECPQAEPLGCPWSPRPRLSSTRGVHTRFWWSGARTGPAVGRLGHLDRDTRPGRPQSLRGSAGSQRAGLLRAAGIALPAWSWPRCRKPFPACSANAAARDHHAGSAFHHTHLRIGRIRRLRSSPIPCVCWTVVPSPTVVPHS